MGIDEKRECEKGGFGKKGDVGENLDMGKSLAEKGGVLYVSASFCFKCFLNAASFTK